jgi:hypothetical protein
MQKIVQNNTNHHVDGEEGHDLNLVIMTRTAQERETISEFGVERDAPSSVRMRRLWDESNLIEADVRIPAEFLSESRDIVDHTGAVIGRIQVDSSDGVRFLNDVAKRWGADGKGWWEREPDGRAVFRT